MKSLIQPTRVAICVQSVDANAECPNASTQFSVPDSILLALDHAGRKIMGRACPIGSNQTCESSGGLTIETKTQE